MKLGSRKSEHLAKSVLLEESGNPFVIRSAVWFCLIVLAAFIAWASFAVVEEVAIAKGEIVPTGQVQRIQHPEGGRIEAIHVDAGDPVRAGQVLISLDKTVAQSRLDEAENHLVFLEAQLQRLKAFLSGNKPDFSLIRSGALGTQVDNQFQIFERTIAAQQADTEITLSQIAQAEAELAVLEQRAMALNRQKNLLDQELSMRSRLFQKGLEAKSSFLALQRQVAVIDGQYTELPELRRKNEAKIAELKSLLKKKQAEIRSTALQELARTEDAINRERQVAKRHARLVALSEIRSSANGIAHGLKAHAVGEVVGPGETILEIVPEDRRLIAEVRIKPEDVGHVAVGQHVTLKFTSYDFARYGGIDGTLEDISPTTFMLNKDEPYYKGTVSFASDGLKVADKLFTILPGMTLQADIRTGDKTVLEYLLKPIYASAQSALRER